MERTTGVAPATRGVADQGPGVPFQTSSLVNRRVLVLSPHQDDESLACGGALLLHTRNLDPVKVVFLTDGSQGDRRSEYRREDYVALRQREARQASQILGVTDLEFWGFPDGGLLPESGPLDRLVQLLGSYLPTLVYAPSPLEFHPDHRAAAALLWRAIQLVQPQLDVAFFEYNRPLQVNTLVDISPVVEEKKRACDLYQSQLLNYPYADCAIGLNRYRALTVSPACTHAEGYVLLSSREIAGGPVETFTLEQLRPQRATREPLVSIIVRTKSRPALLREALSSIQTQTQADLEVIVVNDGGEDVAAVIAEFARSLDVRYCARPVSSGRAAAANAGLKMARGTYINFLDDDDLLYPRHVEKLAAFLEKTGEQVAYSDCEIGRYRWDGDRLALVGGKSLYKGFDFDRERLHFGNYIPIMTAMFRRGLLAEIEPFDESLECLEDWDFWLRLSARAGFHRLPGVTAEYRVREGPSHDWARWNPVVYRKHEQYWTIDNVARAWPRIEAAFEARDAELRDALAQEQQARRSAQEALHAALNARRVEAEGLRAQLHLLQESNPQRLARLLKARLPGSVILLLGRLVSWAERLARAARR